MHELRFVPPIVHLLVFGAFAFAAPSAAAQSCDLQDPERLPFFGDLHVHSSFSFDAYLFETRNDPGDAYAFAKGAPVGIPPLDAGGSPTRTLQLRRPLDFAAVTDHAELLGETSICTTPTHPQYGSQACLLYRNGNPGVAFTAFASMLTSTDPERRAFCGTDGVGCLVEAASVWGQLQSAAATHQSSPPECSFTTFNAYEWSGTPDGDTMHRNVVFGGQDVPTLPLSYVEVNEPEGLWAALEQQCTDVGGDCAVISIPHNPNKSAGRTFDPLGSDGLPMTESEAVLRARMEPLVEIVQHKGDSECRLGVQSNDEQCGFEKLATVPPASDPPLSYVRNALKTGLGLGVELGVNPYVMGFVGATDTHLGAPGATREDEYPGHGGLAEAAVADRLGDSAKLNSPGGLTVLWAEENTRAALFAAMQRREAYATSGTRPVVRFFGGSDYPSDLCARSDFVAQGYAGGVPMGGRLDASLGSAPRFAVSAVQDPGAPGLPGTPLQRIQIVKGWLDAAGVTHEAVYDVAGTTSNGASVDTATCEVSGDQFVELCAVWEDPDFDWTEPAFYYARVLENESCRWSTWLCNAQAVDCSGTPPPGLEACCDGSIPTTIQERAHTSPIWYDAPAPSVPVAGPSAARLLTLLFGCSGLLLTIRTSRWLR